MNLSDVIRDLATKQQEALEKRLTEMPIEYTILCVHENTETMSFEDGKVKFTVMTHFLKHEDDCILGGRKTQYIRSLTVAEITRAMMRSSADIESA